VRNLISAFGQTSGMALGTLTSRITGVVRDIALVAAIGTAIFADTYSVANSIPNIIYILIAGGAINAVFIPALVRHMNDDEDGGQKFTDQLLSFVGLVLLVIVTLGVIFSSFLVELYATSSWSANDFKIATIFAMWFIPQVFFYGVYTIASQVLNARDVFVLPMFAPIVNNLIVIVTSIIFLVISSGVPTTSTVTTSQITLLGVGTTLGVIAQALILIPALNKAGYGFNPRLNFRGSGLGKVADLAIWTIGFVVVNQVSFLVLSNLTTYANVLASNENLVANGFTSYQKAQLMMMLPHSIITVSIVTALLPRLSKFAHDNSNREFSEQLSDAMRVVTALIIPCAALLYLAGSRVGQFLYGYGASTIEQGQALGQVASMFAIGLPAFSLFYVLLRSYYAREDTKTPFFINVGFNVLHLTLGTFLFLQVDTSQKVAALAFAYSVSYIAVWLFTWRRVAKSNSDINSAAQTQLLVRVSVAVAVSIGIAWATTELVTSFTPLNTFGVLLQLITLAITFIGTYYFAAKQMQIKEVSNLSSLLRR
jgi:putative peptidoglycan lipid II flippase